VWWGKLKLKVSQALVLCGYQELVEFTLGSKKTSRKKLFENMTKICGNKKKSMNTKLSF
jgi:phenylalanyl-tRNA synthetase beta subunit